MKQWTLACPNKLVEEPTLINCLTLNDDPKLTESRTESIAPIRVKVLNDNEEANIVSPIQLQTPLPRFAPLNADTALPTFKKALKLNAEPRLKKSIVEHALPNLAYDLIDNVEVNRT
jgi:hypothetical protein